MLCVLNILTFYYGVYVVMVFIRIHRHVYLYMSDTQVMRKTHVVCTIYTYIKICRNRYTYIYVLRICVHRQVYMYVSDT